MVTTTADRLELGESVLPRLLPSVDTFNPRNKAALTDPNLTSLRPSPQIRMNQPMELRSDECVPSFHQDSDCVDEVTMCICPVCGYSASSPRGQDEHMDRVHGEGRVTFAGTTVLEEPPSPSCGYPAQCRGQPEFSPVAFGVMLGSCSSASGVVAITASQPASSESNPQVSCSVPCKATQSSVAMNAIPSLPSIVCPDDSPYDPNCSATLDKTLEYSRWSTSLSYKASECDSSSGDTATAVALQKVDSRRRYRCNMCSETFPWHGDLAEHLRLVHGMQKTRENARSAKAGSFCCVHCKYVAKYQSELRRHMRLHWGVKPFVCVFCPYRSAWKGDLKRHMESHHRERFTSEAELIKIMSQFKNNAGTTLNGVPLSANVSRESSCHGDIFKRRSNDSNDLSPKAHDTTSDEGDICMSSLKTSGFTKTSPAEGDELQCRNCSYRASNLTNFRSHIISCGRMIQCYRCPVCGHDSNHEWEAKIHLNSKHSAFTIAPVAIFDVAQRATMEFSNPQPRSSPDSSRSLHMDTPGAAGGLEISTNTIPYSSNEWSVGKVPINAKSVDKNDFDTVPIDLSISQRNLRSPAIEERVDTGFKKTMVSSFPGTTNHLSTSTVSIDESFTPVLPTPSNPFHSTPQPQSQTVSTDLARFSTVGNSCPIGWPVENTSAVEMKTDVSGVPSSPAVNILFNQWFMQGLMHSWHNQQQPLPNIFHPPTLPQVDITALSLATVDPIVVPAASWTPQTTPSDHVIATKQTPLDLHTLKSNDVLKSSIESLRVSTGWSETDTIGLSSSSNLPIGEADLVPSTFHRHRDSQRARRGRRSGDLRHGDRLSTGMGTKDEQWKRHQCSGCGHRSNWKWDINKHIKVAHPERTSITTVTLDIEEAKRTFGEYMNRLKLSRNRYLSDMAEGAREQYSWQSGGTPACSSGQPAEGYYRPYQCSVCGHRSNWKWDVRKHIKQIHDNKAEVITLSLEEARRTIHQYKNCRRQQTRHCDLKNPAWYSSRDIASTHTTTHYPLNTTTKQNLNEMMQENSMRSTEQTESRQAPRKLKPNKKNEQVHHEEKMPVSSSVISTPKSKAVHQRYPCRVCHLSLPTRKALTLHFIYRHRRPKTAPYLSLHTRWNLRRSLSCHPVKSVALNTDRSREKGVNVTASSHPEVRYPSTPLNDTAQNNDSQPTLNIVVSSSSVNTQVKCESSSSDPAVQSRARFSRISSISCAGNVQSTPPLSSIRLASQQSNEVSRVYSSNRIDFESGCAVRQMSALLDELLSLLGDSKGVRVTHEPTAISTELPEPEDKQQLSHRAGGLIRDAVLNIETPTEINLSNCSSSSNEENHPIVQRSEQGKFRVDSLIHTVLQHPEVGTRLLRLANVLRSVPNMTNCK